LITLAKRDNSTGENRKKAGKNLDLPKKMKKDE